MWQVYDGFLEEFMMQSKVLAVTILLAFAVAAATVQAQASSQPQTAPAGAMSPMGGMDKMSGMDMKGMKMDAAKPPLPTGPLKISYEDKSAEWTPATLAALPHQTVTHFNAHAKANQTYSGVPLTDLLTKLGVPNGEHGKTLKLYLVVQGSDGYRVLFSLGEVTPIFNNSTVIVADSLEGKPITGEGSLQLVDSGDKVQSRWVRNPVSIKVLSVE
jgi:hypothetical protein